MNIDAIETGNFREFVIDNLPDYINTPRENIEVVREKIKEKITVYKKQIENISCTIENLRKEVEFYETATPEALASVYELHFAKEMEFYNELKEKQKKHLAKYLAMQKKVKQWKPPTNKHKQYKAHLLEELSYSIEDYSENPMTKPERTTPASHFYYVIQWGKSSIREQEQFLKQTKEELAGWQKQLQQHNKRTKTWYEELVESLPE